MAGDLSPTARARHGLTAALKQLAGLTTPARRLDVVQASRERCGRQSPQFARMTRMMEPMQPPNWHRRTREPLTLFEI